MNKALLQLINGWTNQDFWTFVLLNVVKTCLNVAVIVRQWLIIFCSLQIRQNKAAFIFQSFSYFNRFHISIVWKHVQERLSGTVSIKHSLSNLSPIAIIFSVSLSLSLSRARACVCVCRVGSRLTSSAHKEKTLWQNGNYMAGNLQ